FFNSLICLLIVIFSPPLCNAGMKVLVVSPDSTEFQLGPYIQILEDTSRQLDITDVSSPRFSDKFLANQSASINQGVTDSPYWLRFSLAGAKNNHAHEQIGVNPDNTEWFLSLGGQLDNFDEIKVFWKEAGGESDGHPTKWHMKTFGMNQAVDSGKRDPLFIRITLPRDADHPVTVYMRIQKKSGFFFKPILYAPEAYNLFSNKLSIFYGGYYGLVLSMLAYNLFHYFFLRDKVRLIFIMYATTLCLYFFVANELSLPILPTSFLAATRKVAQLLSLLTLVQISYFAAAFLDAKRTVPLMYRLLQAVALFSGALILSMPFCSYISIAEILLNFSVIAVLVIMSAGLAAWFRGFQPARFFLLAWVFFLGGGLVYVFHLKGIFPYAIVGNNAFQAGSGIEMLLLSLAIADRMKFLFDQQNQALTRRQKQLNTLTHQLVQTEERERRRIAGILHDSIGQTLIATKWEVQNLLRKCNSSDDLDSPALSYLDSCIKETRSLTAELYPHELYKFGLEAALQSLAEDFSKRFQLTVKVNFEKEPGAMSEELMFILYRAVSELLNNVVKHAHADHAEIVLPAEDGNVSISVQDDGVGFDYPTEQDADITGFGLFSIGERLHRIGGSFKVEKPATGGAKVTISAPLSTPAIVNP
ncbi:MAG: 7TM diverse intracellular signaling domain-containing protein, partial [Thermodesulfobacteriota bacterium]|nr:7TM diverse intracellular signaling domain-containing protein [Thermodesulfobacteriota bacterium]